jgi:hypothetical protein
MANINPRGIDLTTGQSKLLGPGDTLTDSSGSVLSGATGIQGYTGSQGITGIEATALPTKYIQGMEVTPRITSGWTGIDIAVGSCRDREDAADIVVTSPVTVDVSKPHSAGTGLPQNNGVDQIGLNVSDSITCGQTGIFITTTASIHSSTEGDHLYTPYLPTNIVSMSTSGTAFTGGRDIPLDVSVGDLVGNASKGWSRVVTVDSSTTATLIVALPGGDASSESWSIIHNATIWAGDPGGKRTKINTLSASGTTITTAVDAAANITAGSALTIGATPHDAGEIWLAVWATGNSNVGYVSTQHVSLLGFSPSSTPQRHIGWMKWNFEDFLKDCWYENGGINRRVVASTGGSSTMSMDPSYADVQINVGAEPNVPRTAHFAISSVYITNSGTAGAASIRARERGGSSGSAAQRNRLDVPASGSVTVYMNIPIDGAGYYDSREIAGTLSGTVYCTGWIDNLGKQLPSPAT